MSHGKFAFLCMVIGLTLLVGCSSGNGGIANPASVYCQQHSGKLEMHKDAAGNESGACVFADGSSCDEWAYYRGECKPGAQPATPAPAGMANPASVFCEQNGGKLDIRRDTSGGQVGMCVFSDASSCEEWAYFRGECKPGAK